jgi:hypothetical protein
MKFTIQGPFKENINNLMRSLSYRFIGQEGSEMSYVRKPSGGDYPRFHVYLKTENNALTFSLHLDQKRPVYENATAHAGEYDGELVENEAQRIKEATK